MEGAPPACSHTRLNVRPSQQRLTGVRFQPQAHLPVPHVRQWVSPYETCSHGDGTCRCGVLPGWMLLACQIDCTSASLPLQKQQQCCTAAEAATCSATLSWWTMTRAEADRPLRRDVAQGCFGQSAGTTNKTFTPNLSLFTLDQLPYVVYLVCCSSPTSDWKQKQK